MVSLIRSYEYAPSPAPRTGRDPSRQSMADSSPNPQHRPGSEEAKEHLLTIQVSVQPAEAHTPELRCKAGIG